MAFRQYTQCVEIENFDPRNPIGQAALLGLYVTLPAGALPALMAIAGVGSPWCLLLLGEVYLIAGVIGYCYWWLYRRLICIPAPPEHPADGAGDHLAIGTLIDILPPGSGGVIDNIDNDYSIGILLQPNPLGAQLPEVAQSEPFGYLVTEQPVTRDHGLKYTGHSGVDVKCPPQPEISSEVLHCEFEGRGVYDVYLAARVALFPAVAAVFACLIPGVGWIIALILALLGPAIIGGGWIVGQFDAGDPNDVNPDVGELHTNNCDHKGADTLIIKGHWVYDSGHRFGGGAWYELHPITFCTKTTSDSGDVVLLRNRWQVAIGDATSPATLESQKRPQNQWQVHPIIDGCQPPIIV